MNSADSFARVRPAVAPLVGEEILEGLFHPEKWIHPKFFYDERGSHLYDLITQTPEYYPTRTELEILRDARDEIAGLVDFSGTFIEIGAGAIEKSTTVLGMIEDPIRYVAVDISPERLIQSETAVRKINPLNQVIRIESDFTQPLEGKTPARGVVFFPGSTIGNFSPKEAAGLLRSLGKLTSHDGGILVGVDLHKDRGVLEAAYNDSAGYTAAFNLNLLKRIETETGIPLKTPDFEHHAFFNEDEGRIEMHLISLRRHAFEYAGRKLRFEIGESIHTESSYKYTVDGFAFLARSAGFRVERVWTDPKRLFSVQLLKSMD